RGRGSSARQAQVPVVVKADPDYAHQIVGKTREPAIAGGAGFSSRRQSESACADTGSGALVHYVFKQTIDQVSDTGIEDRVGLRCALLFVGTIRGPDVVDEFRLCALATIGKCR